MYKHQRKLDIRLSETVTKSLAKRKANKVYKKTYLPEPTVTNAKAAVEILDGLMDC